MSSAIDNGSGWGASEAAGSCDQAVALKDIGKGGPTGQWWPWGGGRLGAQGPEAGHRTIFAQGIASAESVPQGQNTVPHPTGPGQGTALRATRLVLALDAPPALAVGVLPPVWDGREREPELARGFTQRHPAPPEGLSTPFRLRSADRPSALHSTGNHSTFLYVLGLAL